MSINLTAIHTSDALAKQLESTNGLKARINTANEANQLQVVVSLPQFPELPQSVIDAAVASTRATLVTAIIGALTDAATATNTQLTAAVATINP